MLEAVCWSPTTLFSFPSLMLGIRLATPAALREVFKRVKRLFAFQNCGIFSGKST